MRWILGAVVTVAVSVMGAGAPVAAAAQPALGQPVSGAGEVEMRVYDLRDLAASLPASAGGGLGASAIDVLVPTLAQATGASARPVLAGVYAVAGSPEAHAALESMLRAVRELYSETYQVEIRAVSVAADRAPAVGAAAEAGALGEMEAVARGSASVVRRAATTVASERRMTYIADWSPVVGNNAVGYDPQTSEVEEGMHVTVVVGAGAGERGQGAEGTAGEVVQVRGTITRVEMEYESAPLVGMEGGNLRVGLPRVEERAVESVLRAPLGTPTVVAVVDGFDEGESVIVLVATVSRGGKR